MGGRRQLTVNQMTLLCQRFQLFVLRGAMGVSAGACMGSGGRHSSKEWEIEETQQKRPINILSWLPGRATAVEMLR